MMSLSLSLAILLPFAGALLCFFIPPRWAVVCGLGTALLTAFAVGDLVTQVYSYGVITQNLGGWEAPLGIGLRADGLSAFMLLLTSVVGVVISVFARSYFSSQDPPEERRGAELFWPLWLFLWGAMNALYLSNDIFNIYVLLEVLGLSSVGLLVLTGRSEVLVAGMRYLLAALAGSLSYLLGVVLLYALYSTLDITQLGSVVSPAMASSVAMALMLLGLLLKSAIFPLHFWLPPAHSSATAPVSAILSALVVKASFYLIVRLWFQVFPEVVTFSAGQFMGLLGAGAVLWSSLQALRQERVKMMIAYSTVAQLGYLLFVFPVHTANPQHPDSASWVELAASGALLHALAHALAKASIFLSAGILMHASGSDHLSRMRGLSQRLPVTVFAMAVAAVSLMGLPPSAGFMAKWLTLNALWASGQGWWIPVLIGGSLLAAGYLFILLRAVFLPPDPDQSFHRVSPVLEWSALLLAVVGIVLGLRAAEVLELLHIGSPFAAAAGGMP